MTVLTLAQLNNPMMFETLRDSVTALFQANEQGLYVTIDKQEQVRAAEEFKGTLRTIQVFVQTIDPEDITRPQFENNVTFGLFLRVAEPSTGDVATLENPLSTPAEKQAALLAADPGSDNANKSWDELLRIATRIIMSPLNEDLGLPEFTVSNRVLKTARKDQPLDYGNLIVLTGSAFISANVTEIMDGVTPVAMDDPAVKVKPDFTTTTDGDDVEEPSKLQIDIENPP
jgi:hypothetical protein